MHTRPRTLLATIAVLGGLLAGCGADPADQPTSPTSSSSPSPSPSPSPATAAPDTAPPDDSDPDASTAEYVECLQEHGLENAVAAPDGGVGYGFTEEDLDEDGQVSASAGDDVSSIEARCLRAVPGYVPPDEDER